jgi:hypothetical protein
MTAVEPAVAMEVSLIGLSVGDAFGDQSSWMPTAI